MNKMKLATAFFVGCFLLSALYHLVSIFVPNGIPEPAWEHAIFVIVPVVMLGTIGLDGTRDSAFSVVMVFCAEQIIEHSVWQSLYPQFWIQNLLAISFAISFFVYSLIQEDI